MYNDIWGEFWFILDKEIRFPPELFITKLIYDLQFAGEGKILHISETSLRSKILFNAPTVFWT